jgi:hypothetical protein
LASRRLIAAVAVGAAALAAAGCGGNDASSSVTTTTPTVATVTTPTQVTIPQTTPTATTPPAATATTPSTSPETQPGGAGDEGGMRVPAAFTFAAGGVTPTEVKVPAFFQIELVGIANDGKAHTLGFQGETIDVPAGGRGQRTFTGLRKGTYPVTIDGRAGAATIVSGAGAGP